MSKDGKRRIADNRFERFSPGDGTTIINYHFVDREKLANTRPEDWSVEYVTPERLVSVAIPFVFKNVPLP